MMLSWLDARSSCVVLFTKVERERERESRMMDLDDIIENLEILE